MKKVFMKTGKYLLWLIVIIFVIIVILELFSKYTPAKVINNNAPVKTQRTIIIHAPAPKVWNVLANINQWPQWQKGVTYASLTSPFQEGSIFEWKSNGFSIRSELRTVVPYKTIGWAGEAFGSFAIHIWHFHEENGYTIVTVEESMEGWLISLMEGYVQKNLHTATEQSLLDLKKEAEK